MKLYQVDPSLPVIFVMLVSCRERNANVFTTNLKNQTGTFMFYGLLFFDHSVYSTPIETSLFYMSFCQIQNKITANDNINHIVKFKKVATHYQALYFFILLWFHPVMPCVERIAGPHVISWTEILEYWFTKNILSDNYNFFID